MDSVAMRAAAEALDTVPMHPALPPESPLEMPIQSLRERPPRRCRRLPTAPRDILARRAVIFGGTAVLTGFAAYEMHLALDIAGLTALQGAVLVLFVALFAWIAFAFMSALAGFAAILAKGGRPLGIECDGPLPKLEKRLAILMPTYNEAPARVMANLQAIYESVEAAGAIGKVDFFILSDTSDPDIWIAEEAGFLALRERTGGHARIFYRRRRRNTERKAGNIADWVRRFGGAYESMLVLDADSVMTGDTIVRLAAAMERNPHVGLIQTLPTLVGGRSLFARLQQFAGRLYGPLVGYGLAWWHGAESNFWGHNAIIRTRAFAESAGLPHLRGRKPFGGHILSHDFVEAALLRRRGWAVHMAPALPGSYEEGPPSIVDLAIRDRRWCQGNLQHAGVLPARGLHWVSRIHLLTGIGAYLTAPMWMAMLAIGLLISLQARFVTPEYFPSDFSLFPKWPTQDPVRAAWVFVATMTVLLAPKLLAMILLLVDRNLRRGCGGALRGVVSVLTEIVLSGLAAPAMMVTQSACVIGTLLGRDVGWKPQRRDDGSIPAAQIIRHYSGHTLIGIGLGIAAYLVAVPLFFWMSPVILGLLLAIPIAAVTARRGAGEALRKAGLLLIPEETSPPPVLLRAKELATQLAPTCEPMEAVHRLMSDPRLLDAHRAMVMNVRRLRAWEVEPDRLIGLAKLEDTDDAPASVGELTPPEKAALLADAIGLQRLIAVVSQQQPAFSRR